VPLDVTFCLPWGVNACCYDIAETESYDLLQAANRMMFNQAEDEFLDGDEVVGMGVLGKEGSGRLRMQASHASLCILQDASSCLHTLNYSAAFHVRSMRSAHSKGHFFMLFPHDLAF